MSALEHSGAEMMAAIEMATDKFQIIEMIGEDGEPEIFTIICDIEMDTFRVDFDCEGCAIIKPGENEWLTVSPQQLRRLAKLIPIAEKIWAQWNYIEGDEDTAPYWVKENAK